VENVPEEGEVNKKTIMVASKDGARVVHMGGGKLIHVDGAISVIRQTMMMDTGLNRTKVDLEPVMVLMMKETVSLFHLEVAFKDMEGLLLALVEMKALSRIFSIAFLVQLERENLNGRILQAIPLARIGKKKTLNTKMEIDLAD
jgi:hypothetical protein